MSPWQQIEKRVPTRLAECYTSSLALFGSSCSTHPPPCYYYLVQRTLVPTREGNDRLRMSSSILCICPGLPRPSCGLDDGSAFTRGSNQPNVNRVFGLRVHPTSDFGQRSTNFTTLWRVGGRLHSGNLKKKTFRGTPEARLGGGRHVFPPSKRFSSETEQNSHQVK